MPKTIYGRDKHDILCPFSDRDISEKTTSHTLQKTSLDAMVYDLKVPIVISVFSDCQKQLNKE